MNRKQRRAQPRKAKTETIDDVPLARPPTDVEPPAKTLYELAAERQATLAKFNKHSSKQSAAPALTAENVVNVAIGPNGEIKPLNGATLPGQPTSSADADALPPWIDTAITAFSLAALHFTLEALTHYQYAEDLDWTLITRHTLFQALPLLFLFVHFMHGHLVGVPLPASSSQQTRDALAGLKQLFYMGVANVAGCYLIRLTNAEGYMAVMKNAPSIGTLWVWSVIEMGLVGALVGVGGPGVYAWWYGYGVI